VGVPIVYHAGNRELQDRFDSRRIADRLVEVLHRTAFSDEDREFIETRPMYIASNPAIGMLFIRMGATPKRVRVNGVARVELNDPLMEQFAGAQAIIRVTPVDIFPNCPRYIPDPAAAKASPYVPRAGEAPVEPGWKDHPAWKDLVPPRKA